MIDKLFIIDSYLTREIPVLDCLSKDAMLVWEAETKKRGDKPGLT